MLFPEIICLVFQSESQCLTFPNLFVFLLQRERYKVYSQKDFSFSQPPQDMTICLFQNHPLFPPASTFAITLNVVANALETKLITIIDSGPMWIMQTINLRVFPYFVSSKQPDNHGPCCRFNLCVSRSRFFHLVSKLLFSTLPESKRAPGSLACLSLKYRSFLYNPNKGV